MTLSFYVHIPYCIKRCGYCDFNTYTPSELQDGATLEIVSNDYIDAVLKELEAAPLDEVPTIFFGGGTPSLLPADDLGRVISAIKHRNGLSTDCEITLEANPDSVSAEKLNRYIEVGFNRISFGMQSAKPHVLAALDRTHNPDNLYQVTQWASEVGFKEISVDLIYGTPGESKADWQKTIDTALSLPITHISAYALIIEEGTKLAAQIKRGEVGPVDDDLTAEKYLMADNAFTKFGFDWYELSNWSKPNSESKHNLAYWLGHNWWGAGPGAHSHINGKRFWNVKHPNLYKQKIDAGEAPVADSEDLQESQIESERLMLSIRLPSGVEKSTLNEKQILDLSGYVKSGHLDEGNWDNGRAALTLEGRLIADRIVREILL